MKNQTKTNKKQWIKPEIQVLDVNNSLKVKVTDGVTYSS
jgi:hypothetical protein